MKYLVALLLIACCAPGCARRERAKSWERAKSASATQQARPKAEPIKFHLYLPQENGSFKVVSEVDTMHAAKSYYESQESNEAADEALRRLLKRASHDFPPGTKMVAPFISDGGRPTINLNRAFRNPAWWKNSKRGNAALQALANTAIHTRESTHPSSDEMSLRFLIEGKSITRIGVLHLSRPIESDYLTMRGNKVIFKYQ